MAGLLAKVYVKVAEATKKKEAELKLLSRRELKTVLKLFYEEGWVDFTLADLDYMFTISPKTCFKFVCENQMIGVTFALLLDNGVCYPNSSLIAERHRKTVKYYNEVIKYSEYLKSLCQYEVMYSAKWLVDLYSGGMGYKKVGEIHRQLLTINSLPAVKEQPNVSFEKLTSANAVECHEYLQTIYCSERLTLLQHALKHDFDAWLLRKNGEIVAFSMIRGLPKHQQIGPLVASNAEAAQQLLLHMGTQAAKTGIDRTIMDGDNVRLPKLLAGAGISFEAEGTQMVKMTRGDESLAEADANIFAIYSHYLS